MRLPLLSAVLAITLLPLPSFTADWTPRVALPGATDPNTRLWVSQIFDSFGESITFTSLFILPQAQDSGFETLMSRMRTALQDPNDPTKIDWPVVAEVLATVKATYPIPPAFATQFDNVLARVNNLAQADQSTIETQVFGTADAIVGVLRQMGDLMVTVAQSQAPARTFTVPYIVRLAPEGQAAPPPGEEPGVAGRVVFVRQFSNGFIAGPDGQVSAYGTGSMWQATETFTQGNGRAMAVGTTVTITLDPDSTIFPPDGLTARTSTFVVGRNRNLVWSKDNLRGIYVDKQENVTDTAKAAYGQKQFDGTFRYDERIKTWTATIRGDRFGPYLFPHFDTNTDGWITRDEWILWQAAEAAGTLTATRLALEVGGPDYAKSLTQVAGALVLRDQLPDTLRGWVPAPTEPEAAPEEWVDPNIYVRSLQNPAQVDNPTP
jgi:hypothetical protein